MRSHPILFFADKLFPLVGGMEIHGDHFIKYFNTHSLFPICHTITKNYGGLDTLRKNSSLADWGSLSKTKPSFIFFNSGRWIESLENLRKLFPKTRFIYRTGGNEILKASLETIQLKDHLKRQTHWVNTLNKCIDILITNSSYTEKRLKNLGIICPMRKCVGGVDCSLIKPKKKNDNVEAKFFSAARFVPYKNHSKLIDLFHELITKNHSIHLTLAGDGPLLEKIKEKVKTNEIENHISFVGPLSNKQVFEHLAKADFYIQLSSDFHTLVPDGNYIHSEGMGRSILEAISSGVFVITPASGALPEIVTSERGYLVKSDNIRDMAAEIEKLIVSPLQKIPLTRSYDWVNIFKEYETIFKEIL